MGIDFGEKRIGIALSDPLLTFAYPFTTIQNDSSFFSKLTAIIIEKKIKKIILGLPSSSYKSSKELTIKVLKLKTDIESKNKIDVILWDEEYSSAIAKERVVESVTKKSKRKKKELLDQHSAAVILQEYLDSK
ncbi:MAG: Holliday junction resolvase RuvX [Ignavibacteriaceae bacterium]|jgi:putative Holliday junction resolvase|nr:Holliday junction resolvase RuvX [Ignavibacteriaceae bacterium]